MTVGQVIRQMREARGWSQAKLGVLSGNGPSGISQIETGRRNPSAATLERISEALGVEVGDLFPKGPSSSPEPSFDDALDDEQRAAWEAAADKARRLRETGRTRMWRALSGWAASKRRGEPYASRREYLDEMGSLLQEVYDADAALGWAYIKAALATPGGSDASLPSYLQEESRTTSHFYGELFGWATGAGLSVRTEDDAAAAKRAAENQAEARSHSVQEAG